MDRQITLAGEYEVAGTPALYERDRDREKIRIPGPIKEDIAVYVIYYLNKVHLRAISAIEIFLCILHVKFEIR